MTSRKIVAVGAAAFLSVVLSPGSAHAAGHSTKVFAHQYAYQAQVKCENFQTDLRRSGYQVTTPCKYTPWGNQHAYAVTWRSS